MKNEKLNSKIKLTCNSSFVILIFAILKFRTIGRSTFRRSKFSALPILGFKLQGKVGEGGLPSFSKFYLEIFQKCFFIFTTYIFTPFYYRMEI